MNGKPRIICAYNTFMGAVDLSDQMIVGYNDHRKCNKVWKKIIYHIFHRIMLNSYILYCQNTSQPIMSRLQFTQSVIESLASTYLTKRNAGNNVNPQVRVKKLDGRKERDCVICWQKAEYKKKIANLMCSLYEGTTCRLFECPSSRPQDNSPPSSKTSRPRFPRQVAH